MSKVNADNKKIAKNTGYMYIRLFVTMIIGLYTSRVVLSVLGVCDFGLYNIVGGLLAMFTFISGSLEGATTRFLNVEMGKENGDVNRSFNINIVLHVFLAISIFIVAEVVGNWYIINKLNVLPEKLSDAIFVFQISILTACIGIINGPYASLFNAHEKFGFLAAFDITNTLIRLGCIILLQMYTGNVLRLFAIIMSLTTINSFVVFYWKASREWPSIIKLKLIKGWKNYKDVLTFSNWNLFGTIALVARSSGTDLIINSFFGTAVNGAFAVSKTVNNYITSFSANFDSASGPQITQSLSAGDNARSSYLVNKLGRFCLLLFELVFFPLYIELDFVLHLWLGDVPDGVLVFCQFNLLLAAVALTCGGLTQYINASGKIKWFKINGGFFFLICLPVGYMLFKIGAPAYAMIICFLVADALQRIIQLVLMKKLLGFDSMGYVREAYLKPAIIALIMSGVLLLHSLIRIDAIWFSLLSILLSFGLTAILVYTIGLSKGEQYKIKNQINNTTNRLFKNEL